MTGGRVMRGDWSQRYGASSGPRQCALDGRQCGAPFRGMATPTDQNFQDYKQAEKKALEIVTAMKGTSAKKTDIELALLVALFELHKGTLPPATVGGVIQGHLKQLIPFYQPKSQPTG